MQGAAALDIINHGSHKAVEPEARMVGSQRTRLTAHPCEPEPHGPWVLEQELGKALCPDRNARHGHPGVDCRSLPVGHAHRLPNYKDAFMRQCSQEAEAPSLVTTSIAGEEPRKEQAA